MKKILLASAIVISFLGTTNAQTAKNSKPASAQDTKTTPTQKADEAVAKTNKIVSLTAVQLPIVKKYMLEFFTSIEALKATKKENPRAFERQKEELKEIRNKNISSVLTPEQLKKYADHQANAETKKATK